MMANDLDLVELLDEVHSIRKQKNVVFCGPMLSAQFGVLTEVLAKSDQHFLHALGGCKGLVAE